MLTFKKVSAEKATEHSPSTVHLMRLAILADFTDASYWGLLDLLVSSKISNFSGFSGPRWQSVATARPFYR